MSGLQQQQQEHLDERVDRNKSQSTGGKLECRDNRLETTNSVVTGATPTLTSMISPTLTLTSTQTESEAKKKAAEALKPAIAFSKRIFRNQGLMK
jgi:hypothetical protein